MEKTSPHVIYDPRPNGGSMFRIHRDTRCSRDKAAYKTHASAHFRHRGGMWMPEPAALLQIRKAIANKPADWKEARDAPGIERAFGGVSYEDKLTKAPRGFEPEHALIEDIKLKSFFVKHESNAADAAHAAFVKTVAKAYADAAPVIGFLCRAMGAKF